MSTGPNPTLQSLAQGLQGYDPQALPVATAQAFIAGLVPTVQAVEKVPIRDALGRVLAEDLISPIDVPSHDNAAMDGFALRGADLDPAQPTRLRIAGSGLAGQPFAGEVPAGACVRITTGAVMPAGLDTVLPQELAAVEGADTLCVPAGVVRPGEHRSEERRVGKECRSRWSPYH